MKNKEKWSFILNPTAGGGFGSLLLPELEKQLANRSMDATIQLTERHDHAPELSQKCLEKGCTHIIAVGGDGTMNEVLNGVAELDIPLAIIPAGLSNVVAVELGIKPDINKMASAIFEKRIARTK